MRNPIFDPMARKRTVSLTLNGDLYAKAKARGSIFGFPQPAASFCHNP